MTSIENVACPYCVDARSGTCCACRGTRLVALSDAEVLCAAINIVRCGACGACQRVRRLRARWPVAPEPEAALPLPITPEDARIALRSRDRHAGHAAVFGPFAACAHIACVAARRQPAIAATDCGISAHARRPCINRCGRWCAGTSRTGICASCAGRARSLRRQAAAGPLQAGA